MPLFDYRCSECGKRFALLLGVVAEPQAEKCPNCGSENVVRLISRFSRLRSEDDIVDSLSDPAKMGDIDDPRQLQSWMKHIGDALGEEAGGDFGQILEEIDSDENGSARVDL